ncbi:LOW QUALITY PROTEIN: ICAM4 isoform 2 [Pongo abelii]|uniref:ICAM4 isoform 2 n=1 Tax=Pongo abelii TaxID=9601 RepID=H2NXJ0_PONAB|nr:LOW QUALITY PROTEIN: ICAM4 isoform 2 [Pongo abelii]
MGSLFPLSLLFFLAAAYPGVGSALGCRTKRAQGPKGSPLAPSGTSVPFWVRVSPEFVAVPPGKSVWLNCSNSCPQPQNSSLRTRLRQGKTSRGPGWVSYQLLDVRAWSSHAHCLVTCAGKTRWATARITAYSVPGGLLGGDPEAWKPGHLFRKPGALHRPGSGQRDLDLRVSCWTPRLLAARDLPRASQSRRPGGPQQLGTHYTDARLEPRAHSFGLRFHRCPCGDPPHCGRRVPVQVPSYEVPGIKGDVLCRLSEKKRNMEQSGELVIHGG